MLVTTRKSHQTDDEPAEDSEAAAEGVAAEAVAAEDDADSEAGTPAERDDDTDNPLLAKDKPTKRAWWRRFLRGSVIRRCAVAAIVVAVLCGSGYLGWQSWQQHEVSAAGREAQQSAVGYAQILTSVDSNKIDQNFTEVLDGATGEFKDMYTQASVQLRQLLLDNKATAHGTVIDSAIESQTEDKVVVLLFVDQTVTNTNVPEPRIDRSRVKITMEKVDGRWRASKIELR